MLLQAVSAVSPSSLRRGRARAGAIAASSGLAPLLINNSATTAANSNFMPSAANLSFLSSSLSTRSGSTSLVLQTNRQKGFTVFASDKINTSLSLTGVLFQPFEEIKKEEFLVPLSPNDSLARQRFCDECEAAINVQIK